MGTTVHCHVPITVRLRGDPDEAALAGLREAVGRAVRDRLAEAERALAAPAGQRDLQDPPRTGAAGDVLSERYDEERDLPEGYAMPSYRKKGRYIPLPVTEPPSGLGFRVLRSAHVRAPTNEFFSWVEGVMTHGASSWGGALPGRALYEDMALSEHYVAVWLVEVRAATSLAELMPKLGTRALQLLGNRRARTILHAATVNDSHVDELANYDTNGEIAALPLLYRANARRVFGNGPATQLLRGGRVVWAGMELPEITPESLIETGPVGTLRITLTDAGVVVPKDLFAQRFGLTWQELLDEAGSRLVRVDYLPVRTRKVVAEAAIDYAARVLLEVAGLPAPATGDTAETVVDYPDAAGIPTAVRDAVNTWSAGLPPLPPPPKDKGKPGPGLRAPAGKVAVACRAHLPFDVETIGAARLRPVGRRFAGEVRTLLAKDTEDRIWKYDFYHWVSRNLKSPPESRPPGGTPWEYALESLDNTGHLDALFAALDFHDWSTITFPILMHSRATTFANHRLVADLFERTRRRWIDVRKNGYRIASPGVPAGVDLDKDGRWITVGGADVLGEFESSFLTERTVKELSTAAQERFKTAILAEREGLVKRVAEGTETRDLTDETFLREVIEAACARAKITDDDFVEITISTSLRLLDVRYTPHYGLPRWTVKVVRVEKRSDGGTWTPIGSPVERIDDDFEAALIYARLGKAGEFYRAMGIAITVVGLIAVAWSAGIIAALVAAGGGAKMVIASIAISELIYIVRVVFFDAKLTLEGFLMAGVEGYLNAVGFRLGLLAGSKLGTSIGTATLRRVWGGIIAEKLAIAVVGGAVSGVLTQFAHDVVEIAIRDGTISSWRAYVGRMTVGAAFGFVAEFGLSPVLRALGAGGRSALTSIDDIVKQLKAEGYTLAQAGAATAEALSRLRVSALVFAGDASVDGLIAALSSRLAPLFGKFVAEATARRVLELAGAQFSRHAVAGLERFLQAADDPASAEAARRLAATFAKSPQQAVHLMEVLSTLRADEARRLLTGTFNSADDLAAFLSRIARYTPDQQRGILALLVEADLVARPPTSAGSSAQSIIDRQFERSQRLQADAARREAARLRREAWEIYNKAELADTLGKKSRADTLIDQAAAQERIAAQADKIADDLAAARGDPSLPNPPGALPRDLPGDNPAALADELDAALSELEAGTGSPVHAVWINLRAEQLGPQHVKALTRVLFSSRSGNPVVFRVEGGTGGIGQQSREYITIDGGNARIRPGEKKLNINVGSFERAVEFILEARPGARIKFFEVDATYLKNLRSILTPEQGHPMWLADVDAAGKAIPGTAAPTPGSIADVQRVGRTVDTRQAVDQLQLDAQIAAEMNDFIIPGTARVLGFSPRTGSGKAVPTQ